MDKSYEPTPDERMVIAWLRDCKRLHDENAGRRGQKLARKHHAVACHYAALGIETGEHRR